MGAAKRRGTLEERIAQAIARDTPQKREQWGEKPPPNEPLIIFTDRERELLTAAVGLALTSLNRGR